MLKMVFMLTIIFSFSFSSIDSSLAQTYSTLQPGKLKAEMETMKKARQYDTDAKPARRLKNQSIQRQTPTIDQNECQRTIYNCRTTDDWEVNFGFTNPSDSGAVWFQAPADMKVLAVRIRSSNWVGNLLMDFWKTPYMGDVKDWDVLGDSRYIGGGNSPLVPFSSPLGEHIAGPIPRTIGEADIYLWTEIEVPAQPEFSQGESFLVGIWFQITDGWGFTAEYPIGCSADLFKFYGSGVAGPDGVHDGWYIREYHLQMEVLVEYTGDTSPFIEGVTAGTRAQTTDPITVEATITDINCADGNAGVADAFACHSIEGGAYDCVEMTADGDLYTGDIPEFDPFSSWCYYVRATDVMGNTSTSPIYCYPPPARPNEALLVNNDQYSTQRDLSPIFFNAQEYYPPDVWETRYDGQIPIEVWNMYDKIIWYDGCFPYHILPIDILVEWLESGTADAPKCFYMASQDYGCALTGDCSVIEFDHDDPQYIYLGLAGIGPQDVSDEQDCYPLDGIEGNTISWSYFDVSQAFGQLYYSPEKELGFTSYIDNITPTPHAAPCFFDVTTGNPVGVFTDGGTWKTTFLAFAAAGLDFGDPCPANWALLLLGENNGALGNAFNWCSWPADPMVLSLKSKDMHDCHGNHWNHYEDCAGGKPSIIVKPDSPHHVCVHVENVQPDFDIEVLHCIITWDGGIQFLAEVPSFANTCMDSIGWDIKYHYNGIRDYGIGVNQLNGPGDTLEVWLIGGGNAQEPLSQDKCVLNLTFHVHDESVSPEVIPGAIDTISFLFAEFNEGSMAHYIDVGIDHSAEFHTIINRPPEIVTSVPETVHVGEMEEICFTIEATDPDGDSLIMWTILDPYPCDGAQPDTVSGCGLVTMEWCWIPPKLGACDTLRDTTIIMSTFQTDQPLYDTLTTVIIVDDCEILTTWPDTSLYACGWFELPLRIHPDYDCLADLDLTSAYFEVDYDPAIMTVGEVGVEGLITEEWGTLTYNIDEENGTIAVAMAGNYPLPQCDPICTWYDFFYIGFEVHSGVSSEDSALLSIEHVKFNEGEPTACWIDTTWLYFHDFSVRGRVFYSDSDTVWVPRTKIATVQACDSEPSSIDTTDAGGWFESLPWPGCSVFCLEAYKENTLTIEDQIVTSMDAVMILRSLCGQIVLSHNDSLAADVTGDGTVSAFDASAIMKWVVCENCGTPLIPQHNIGDWIFEYYGDLADYHGDDCWCYDDLRTDHLYELIEAVIVGDVSQNWLPDVAPKVGAGDLPVTVSGNTLNFTFSDAYAVDMTLRCEMEPVDVTANADLVEWARTAEGTRVAAVGVDEVREITVTFARMTTIMVEATVLINETQVLSTVTKTTPMPAEYALEQNYPNPFNPRTDIRYQIADSRYPTYTTLKIYNILGQEVRTLVDEAQKAGYYSIAWDGRNDDALEVPSGLYFYRFNVGNFTAVKSMILMK